MISLLRLAAAAFAATCLAAPAVAQDTSLRASYGEISLNAGFPGDPYVVPVTSGGTIDAADSISNDCRGQISNAPDFQLTYSAGSLPLAFVTDSPDDTTLIVNGPDGQWYCDDDSAGSLNARVLFSKPLSGVYDVWVGSFGGGYHKATLNVTELP